MKKDQTTSAVPWMLRLSPKKALKTRRNAANKYAQWVKQAIGFIEPPLWRPGSEVEPVTPFGNLVDWKGTRQGRLLH